MNASDLWITLAMGFLSGAPFGFAMAWAICAIRQRKRTARWQFLAERPWIEPGPGHKLERKNSIHERNT